METNVKPNDRLELDHMDDPYTKLKPGDQGTVTFIDGIGQIHMKWDNGSCLALYPREDQFHKVN